MNKEFCINYRDNQVLDFLGNVTKNNSLVFQPIEVQPYLKLYVNKVNFNNKLLNFISEQFPNNSTFKICGPLLLLLIEFAKTTKSL